MSQKKRRKISRDDEKRIKTPLRLFKEEIMSEITKKMWYLECQAYTTDFKKKYTKCFVVKFVRLTRYRRKAILYSKGQEIQNQFNNMTPSERVDEIASFTKYEEYILKRLLNRLKHTKLKSFLKKHFPKDVIKGAKIHLINEIVDRWFERSGQIEKREMEATNLEDFVHDPEFQRIFMCDILVPREILILIFSFFQYNRTDFLSTVGATCKVFYFTILSSWPSLIVRNQKVYELSVLVLRSIRKISLQVYNDKELFRNQEMTHLFNNLNSDQLTSMVLEMGIYSYVKTLKFLCRSSKKFSCFQNIRTFRYSIRSSHLHKDKNAASSSWEKIRFKKIFPRLRSVCNPLKFEVLEGCNELKELNINLSYYQVIKNESIYPSLRKKKQQQQQQQSMMIEEEIENSYSSFLKTTIEKLLVRTTMDSTWDLMKFIEGFERLVSVEIRLLGYHNYDSNIRCYPLMNIFKGLKDLQSITIHNFMSYGQFGITEHFPVTVIPFSYNVNVDFRNLRICRIGNIETISEMHVDRLPLGMSIKDFCFLLSLPSLNRLDASVRFLDSTSSSSSSSSSEPEEDKKKDDFFRVIDLLLDNFGRIKDLNLHFLEVCKFRTKKTEEVMDFPKAVKLEIRKIGKRVESGVVERYRPWVSLKYSCFWNYTIEKNKMRENVDISKITPLIYTLTTHLPNIILKKTQQQQQQQQQEKNRKYNNYYVCAREGFGKLVSDSKLWINVLKECMKSQGFEVSRNMNGIMKKGKKITRNRKNNQIGVWLYEFLLGGK